VTQVSAAAAPCAPGAQGGPDLVAPGRLGG